MFYKHKTKWLPLGNFSFQSKDYIVFVRGDKKTGMLDFKTRRVNGLGLGLGPVSNMLPASLINTKTQWDAIIEMVNQPKNQ